MKTFKILINHPELETAKSVITERLKARGITEDKNGELTLNLNLDKNFTADSYKITGGENNITITADSVINIISGAGSFLHNSRYSNSGIEPSEKRGLTHPDCSLRGIYLANHFHNYFHTASFDEIRTYIEDMALIGFNALLMASPTINLKKSDTEKIEYESQRLYGFFKIAKQLGMKTATMISTSTTYEDFPRELEFTMHDANNNSGTVMCISKEGVLDIIEEENREYLEGIKNNGIELDFVCTWPYDEGGCNCEKCRPWGRNGYVRACIRAAQTTKEVFPEAKLICSTWTFDYNPEFANNPEKSEWKGLSEALAENCWADYILADAHEEFPRYPLENGVPGNLPLVSFPEISMWGLYPWGGFGANPLPKRMTKVWHQTEGMLMGEFLYSEGIYEDINKYIIAGLCEDYNKNPNKTLANYGAYQLGCQDLDKFIKLTELIEYNHWLMADLVDIKHVPQDIIVAREALQAKTGVKSTGGVCDIDAAKEAYELAQEINASLPNWSKNSWRWRIIYIRALLDYHRYSGIDINTNELTISAMHELIDIFHCLKRNTESDPFHERVRPSCPEYD